MKNWTERNKKRGDSFTFIAKDEEAARRHMGRLYIKVSEWTLERG